MRGAQRRGNPLTKQMVNIRCVVLGQKVKKPTLLGRLHSACYMCYVSAKGDVEIAKAISSHYDFTLEAEGLLSQASINMIFSSFFIFRSSRTFNTLCFSLRVSRNLPSYRKKSGQNQHQIKTSFTKPVPIVDIFHYFCPD